MSRLVAVGFCFTGLCRGDGSEMAGSVGTGHCAGVSRHLLSRQAECIERSIRLHHICSGSGTRSSNSGRRALPAFLGIIVRVISDTCFCTEQRAHSTPRHSTPLHATLLHATPRHGPRPMAHRPWPIAHRPPHPPRLPPPIT